MSENLYSINDVEAEKFYQLPKQLFTLKRYANLSNEARVLYAILKDRLNLSIKNRWVDEEGNVYFNYSRQAIADLLMVSLNTAKLRFKELENAGLLIEKRVVKNRPIKLYLCKIKDDPKVVKKYFEGSNFEGSNFEGSNFEGSKLGAVRGQNLLASNTNIIILNIYNHFNSKNIILHRQLNSNISSAINNALKKYTAEKIIQGIDNYAEILHSDYYYNHKWSLDKFLKQKNGLPEFLEDGTVFINYKVSEVKKEGVRVNQPVSQENKGIKPKFKIILEEDM